MKKGEPMEELLPAVVELLAVANWRGDDVLPHPSEDENLWTARMQEAWDELHQIVDHLAPGEVEIEQEAMGKNEII